MTWIQLPSDHVIDLLDLDLSGIPLDAWAYNLACERRFSGCGVSVAEHCVFAARRVRQLVTEASGFWRGPEDPEDSIRWGLTHDAAEALGLRDLGSPWKQLRRLTAYKRLETEILMGPVADRFRLPKVIPAVVKRADDELGKTERDQFMGPEVKPWPGWEKVKPLDMVFPNWTRGDAAREWLAEAEGMGLK